MPRNTKRSGAAAEVDQLKRQLDAKRGRLLDIESRLADLPDELEHARDAAGEAVASGKDASAAQRRVRTLADEQDALTRAKALLTDEVAALQEQFDAAGRRAFAEATRLEEAEAAERRAKVMAILRRVWTEELLPLNPQALGKGTPIRLVDTIEALDHLMLDPNGRSYWRPEWQPASKRERPTSLAYR